jgi:hypothetical protein
MSSDLWSEPPKDVLENAPEGISLLAPDHAELSSRSTLPVIIRRHASMAEAARVPLEHFAVAIAVDVKRDRVWAARAVAGEDDAPPFEAPSQEDVAGLGGGETTQIVQADLRARLGLPWRPAQLQLWAVAGGLRSKLQRVELLGAAAMPAKDDSPPEAPVAPSLHDAHAPKLPGVQLEPHGAALRGGLRVHGDSHSALVHLVFVFQDDGFVSQRDFRVSLHAGVGGFELGVKDLAGINPGRPLWVWAFAHDAASNPVLYTLPAR